MKKVSDKERLFHKKFNEENRFQGNRLSKRKRSRRIYSSDLGRVKDKITQIRILRRKAIDELYRDFDYKGSPLSIKIEGEYGLEDDSNFEYFLDKSSEIIDFNTKALMLDLAACTRMWPSAITLFSSLQQWVEMCSKGRKHKPLLGSTDAQSKEVNSYLVHSGFYEYVKRQSGEVINNFPVDEVLKIRREVKKEDIDIRENEIATLLKSHSGYSASDIERFVDRVLIEIFNNVTEHGIPHRDAGWWLLAQRHEKHKIISLCIADNGIGIRQSLLTGPQRKQLRRRGKNSPKYDGEFIKAAIEEKVSGAINASLKEEMGFFIRKHPRGKSRGNGLKRIKSTLQKLKMPWTVLSHHGYIHFTAGGTVKYSGSRSRRVFAGTMYHINIPIKEVSK